MINLSVLRSGEFAGLASESWYSNPHTAKINAVLKIRKI